MPTRRRDVVSDQGQLDAAHVALSNCDWQGAYDAVSRPGARDDPALDADRLEVLADAAWWLGRLDECIDAREAAYARWDELGEPRRAGQCAVWLYEHYCFKARPATEPGWRLRSVTCCSRPRISFSHGTLA